MLRQTCYENVMIILVFTIFLPLISLLFMFQSCENESRNLDLEGLHESIVDGSDDEDELAGSIDVSIYIEHTWSGICTV